MVGDADERSDREPDREFAARMDALIQRAGGVAPLERSSGVSRRMIDKYRSGRVDPSRERLIALARGGQVSLHWLATGDGPIEIGLIFPEGGSEDDRADLVLLPRYDVKAAAGVGGGELLGEPSPEYVYFNRSWLQRTLGRSSAQLALLVASGDSMSPTINDGDVLIIDVSDPRFHGDGVYVLSVDEVVVVKRVALRIAGGLWISSDNPRYREVLEIPPGDVGARVRIAGRVVWVGGRIQ